jgi:hypothetical protein
MSFLSRFRKPPASAVPQKPPETMVPAAPSAISRDAAALAAQEEEALKAAIAAKDDSAVAKAVLDGSSTKIRQLAAQAVEDPEQIRDLLKRARGGKDKSVYKILTRKRDALLAHEREIEQQRAEISAVSASIERHSRRVYDALFTPTLEQLENRWRAIAERAEPDVARQTQAAIDLARNVIADHLRAVAAQAARELVAANEAAAERERREREQQEAAAAAAARARASEEERQAELQKREAEVHALKQIGGLLRKAHGALASGNSRVAGGLRRAIDEKLSSAPALPSHLAKQLKQLDEKLDELKDWKSFSVAPKRTELIERMQSFIGATMHPTALAGHIKELQEQWRTLSKGAGEDTEADWQRFHEAAQKAYQPCREYFEAQDQIKKQNLDQRAALFERLLAFESNQNWEQPDWRTVITAVREAKQLWRQHSPVDLAEGEELQRKFNELTASLQNRIDAEYARNVKQKRLCIERARALVSASDSRAAIDEVKRLQERWKAVGPVPRDEDRKLWEEFREQCDSVFQKRQQEFATHNAALETNKSQAVALCEELEQISALSGAELLERTKKLPELRVAFDAIEELPRSNARQLQDRFERAYASCKQAVAEQQSRDVEQGWIAVVDAVDPVRAYRLALLRQAPTAELEVLKQAAEQQLSSITRAPKGGVDALRAALEQFGNVDLSVNELALRTLCIRAEVLTDTPTPANDQSLRREHQLRRLMEGIGQGGGTAAEGELDSITLEWLNVGPVEDATYAPLVERLKECRRRALLSKRRGNKE